MKIEQDRFGGSTLPVDGPAAAGARQRPRRAAGDSTVGADSFTASSDVFAVRSAIAQAAAQPDIREDVVARMRTLLDRGELADDPVRLADSIIDRWLTS